MSKSPPDPKPANLYLQELEEKEQLQLDRKKVENKNIVCKDCPKKKKEE